MNDTGKQAGSFVLLGKVVKAHGIRGEVKIYSFTESAENLNGYKKLYFSEDDGATRVVYTTKKVRTQGKTAVVSLEQCANRNQAELMVGLSVWVNTNDLPQLTDGELYLHSLQGKTAFSVEGQNLGKIVAVITGKGQDLLSVQSDGKEYLIPFVSDFIAEYTNDTVVFSLPPGLLDING